jgi:hypothetical protein
MPESSFVARLRQSGGPSHELLVLLDQHRVLTTDQCARATGTPERTVRYRLDRLREHGLVASVRPGREAGSAPAHWWLRPAGARLVAGTAVAEGHKAPSGMHMAHAAAIAEVWLALREHGPAAGLTLIDWWTDRAGWQEWAAPGGYGGARRLTPDALAHVQVDGPDGTTGTAALFVEVDLASMTQTLLKDKVARYLGYAQDRAWEGVHPNCPPMLLLTTTASRASTFARGAARQLAHQDRPRYRRGEADVARAQALVVAACGLVREPARAVTELCWILPDPAAAEVSLAELLAERIAAQARADAWYDQLDATTRVAEQRSTLYEIARDDGLDELLGDERAGDALRLLVGTDASGLMDAEPELAAAVLAWWADQDTDTAPVRAALLDRHAQLWAEHARTLLAAHDHIAADDPHLAVYARALQDVRLLADWQLKVLAEPPKRTRARVQADALRDYPARRAAEVKARWDGMSRWARRRTSVDELAAGYDAEQLQVCDTCGTLIPRPDPDRLDDYHDYFDTPDECRFCGDGRRIDYARRGEVPTLAQRLAEIRTRLRR